MYDFSNSSIYILKNNVDDKFYIGSTIYSLETRFDYHTGARTSSWNTPRTSPLYVHFNQIGWHNATITLLEKVNCLSRDHLHIYETKHILPHINNKNCLNVSIPFYYYRHSFLKSSILNSSADNIFNQFLHYKKFKKVLNRLLKLTKIYPTDYIYGRAKYLFQFVLKELTNVTAVAPPTCPLDSTIIPVLTPCQPKKRGRPRKHTLPDPSTSLPPNKYNTPKTLKNINTSQNAPVIPPPPLKPRSKFSKKISNIIPHSIVPLTSFISTNSV